MRETLHPGIILLHEVMQPYDISQNALARCIGVSPRRINEIVHGKRSISADTAIGLEEALGISALLWLKLQAEYDLARCRVQRPVRPPAEVRDIGGWWPLEGDVISGDNAARPNEWLFLGEREDQP